MTTSNLKPFTTTFFKKLNVAVPYTTHQIRKSEKYWKMSGPCNGPDEIKMVILAEKPGTILKNLRIIKTVHTTALLKSVGILS